MISDLEDPLVKFLLAIVSLRGCEEAVNIQGLVEVVGLDCLSQLVPFLMLLSKHGYRNAKTNALSPSPLHLNSGSPIQSGSVSIVSLTATPLFFSGFLPISPRTNSSIPLIPPPDFSSRA